jgi:hypothetical protein
MRVVVTATNADDNEIQSSVISAAVTAPPAAPSNSVLPAVSGLLPPGSTLTTTNGTWSPAGVTYSYEWLRCNDATLASCAAIGSQTASTYVIVAGDVGKYIRSRVTAANITASVPATSAPTGVIPADTDGDGVVDVSDTCPAEAGTKPNGCLPSDIVGAGVPTVSGTLTVGLTLSATTGSWTVLHDPLGYTLAYQWQRCDDATAGSCSNISGATSNSYVLTTAEYTKRVRVVVTASNADDAGTTQASVNTGAISQVPGNLTLPGLSGTARVGAVLTATNGTWTPASGVTFANTWLRCTDNSTIGSCTTIPSQTASTYTLVAADDGKYIRGRITASSAAGNTLAESAASAIVITDSDADGVADASDVCPGETGTKPNGCLPSVIVGAGVPTVSGTLTVGQTVSSTLGVWNTLHDPLGFTVTYQWQRCDDATPGSCSDIGGATASTYVLTTSEYLKRVRVITKATNSDSNASQPSVNTAAISQIPANTIVPALSGTARVGQTLTASNGSWTPASGVTFTNAWWRCTDNVSIGSCTAIPSQTGTTYTLVAADDGKYIRARVTGATTAGTSPADSAASAKVITDGDGDGVPDATDACPAEVGTKPNGCLLSDIVANGIPTISGILASGNTLTSTTGSWQVLHDPLGYTVSYRWQSCVSVGNCTDISGATASTLLLTSAEIGKLIRVITTATNADDSAGQSSNYTNPITVTPSNTALPTLSGTARVGAVMTAGNGTWTPAGDTTLTNSWLRCTNNSSIASCSVIASQTATTYTLVAADDGKYIRARLTGSNVGGSSVAESAASAIVITDADLDGVADGVDTCPGETGTKPNGCQLSVINGTGVPTISGTTNVGQALASTTGSWQVLHDPLGYALTYQWQRCTSALAASCSDIGGATNAGYTLIAADYGNRVRVNVKATNADSNATQSSAISSAISQTPANTVLPSITGTAKVGQILTAVQGTWTPADAVLTNVWLRCTDTTVGSCAAIPSQTGSTYTLVAADDSKYIRLRVTGTTAAGNAQATSAATAQVITVIDGDGDGVPDATDTCPTESGTKPNGCLPSVINGSGVPTISGTTNVGQSLASTTGSWQVLHDPLGYTTTYQWQRCTSASTASCSDIGGATNAGYTLISADYGNRVRVNVKATNADSNATQSSAITSVISQVPANTAAPSISGTAKVGQVLTASQGTWTPADAVLTNVWLRCNDATLGSCSAIPSQTGSSYTLVVADNAKYIRLQVTGTTTAAFTNATSNATAQVITDTDNDGVVDASDACPAEAGTKPNGCLPSDVVAGTVPTISGTHNVGQLLTSSTGTWSVLHDPLGYTLGYQWQRCTSTATASCSNIGGATNSTYTLVALDYGNRVRVNVTATNADDSALQSSAISNQISQTPANTALPAVTGTAKVGQTLTTTNGTWTPADAVLTIAWQRCTTTATASCTAIPSATNSTYDLVDADNGNYIRAKVTGTTTAASTPVFSAATAQVIKDTDNDGVVDATDACPAEAGTKPNGCLPSDIVGGGVPTVSGNLVVGQTVSSTTGTWSVLHDQLGYTLGYQWQRCDDATAASCSNIASATGSNYVLTASELTKRVRVNVTASNADDSVAQTSAISTAVIPAGSAPVNNTLPAITGTAEVGQSLTADDGSWTPVSPALARAWMRCSDTTAGSCSPIASATSATYAVVAADVDNYLRVQFTATANAQDTVVLSAPTAKVTAPAVTPPTGSTPGTGGPATPSGPNPAEITGPIALKTLKPTKKGKLTFSRVSVYCGLTATGNCTGNAVLTGKVGSKTKKLGTMTLSQLRGGGRIISFKLSKTTLKALKKKKIKAELAVTYVAPGFPAVTFIGKATLQKPKSL